MKKIIPLLKKLRIGYLLIVSSIIGTISVFSGIFVIHKGYHFMEIITYTFRYAFATLVLSIPIALLFKKLYKLDFSKVIFWLYIISPILWFCLLSINNYYIRYFFELILPTFIN